MEPNANPNGANGRRTGTVNYLEDELESLMELIVEVLPIDSEQWDTVVTKHAVKYPFDRSKKSIRNKYNAIKKKKSSTGNPNMPRYVMLARRAHYLIGKKANLGTGEEDFDMKKGFAVDEAEEGLDSIPSKESPITPPAPIIPPAVGGGGAPIIPLAAVDESTIDSSVKPSKIDSSSVKPSKVLVQSSSSSNKRSYSKVPDATVFNEYLKSQQERAKENRELALEQSKLAKEHSVIAKEASQIAKETNLMWKNALAMAMSCFQQWQSTQVQQSRATNNDIAPYHQLTEKRPRTATGEESHGEND